MVDRTTLPMDAGRVVATPAALEMLAELDENPATYVSRHLAGDWGAHGTYATTEVTERERQYGAMATDDDAKLNRLAVDQADGSRVMSKFIMADGRWLWVVTEGTGEHRNTCVLLPSDY
jgi:uncharacterized protein YchJ